MGLLIIISSPTGGGKDAVIARLTKIFPNSARLVTTTSRAPRPTDQEGITYNFIDKDEFGKKIKAGYFLEYNNMIGNYYGTPKEKLKNLLNKFQLVFSNLDVNGKHSLDTLGIKNLSIFLLPENLEVLKNRAEKRGGMTAQMIADRIEVAKAEIKAAANYDYQITNYDGKLQQTTDEIISLIKNHLKNTPPPS